jgi:hypothetical protein
VDDAGGMQEVQAAEKVIKNNQNVAAAYRHLLLEHLLEVVVDEVHHEEHVVERFVCWWEDDVVERGREHISFHLRKLSHDADFSEDLLKAVPFVDVEPDELDGEDLLVVPTNGFVDHAISTLSNLLNDGVVFAERVPDCFVVVLHFYYFLIISILTPSKINYTYSL